MAHPAEYWINNLNLTKHPEGGYFKETYRSDETITKANLPNRFEGNRNFSTAIYFLLKSNDISALHRIKQDEIWHFYYGSPLTIHIINKDGLYQQKKLGLAIGNSEQPQITVKAGNLFGATVNQGNSYTIVGCTVAPGFDFDDFDMPRRDTLLKEYPEHAELIKKLTII
jgi:uncharacterized protein